DEDAATGAAAVLIPGADAELPHAGEEGGGVVRVHGEAAAAGLVIHLEHLGPGLAAVAGAVDAALGVVAVALAHGADEDLVGVVGVDDDVGDLSGLLEAHVPPVQAGVGGAVDAVDGRGRLADDGGLAGARPDDIGRRGGDG